MVKFKKTDAGDLETWFDIVSSGSSNYAEVADDHLRTWSWHDWL